MSIKLILGLICLIFPTNGLASKITARTVVFKNAIFGQGSGALPLGIVDFTQETVYLTNNIVRINGTLAKLSPGYHGFHIHTLGDFANGCGATNGHFNPENKNHGDPTDKERHLGDLGNIRADANGVASVEISDNQIALFGPNSIIGRAMVISANRDDLGNGLEAESLKNGNSGPRVACGIIGLTSEEVVVYRAEQNACEKTNSKCHECPPPRFVCKDLCKCEPGYGCHLCDRSSTPTCWCARDPDNN